MNSSHKCVDIIEDCIEFDSDNNVCLECVDTGYLTYGICCDLTQIYRQGVCVDMTDSLEIANCNEVEEGECTKCTTDHYLTHDSCCLYGQRYVRGESDQGKPNCKDREASNNCNMFGDNEFECLGCDDGYINAFLSE